MLNTRNQSALFATILFCGATLLALLSFRQLAANVRQPNDQLFALKSGKHSWQLFDQNTKCIGNINLEFEHSSSSSSLNASGSVRLKTPAGSIPLDVTVEMNFNDLGQLGGSILRLKSENISASIGSMNVAPVNIRIRHQLSGQNQRVYDLSIPGPIFIEPVSSDTYRLRYRYLENFNLPQSSWLKLDRLIALRDADPQIVCDQAALDISDLLFKAQSMLQALPDIEQLLRDFK